MKSGWLSTHINRILDISNKIEIFSERGSGEIPLNGSQLADWTYEKFWQESIRQYWFDIKLKDEAFFIFQENVPERGNLKFSFYECPYKPKPSFEDYLKQSPDALEETKYYEYELLTPDKKEAVTPIRYEYREKDFAPYLHPVSHFHFGLNNEIRVGSYKKLTPFAFFLFIIRQFYPETWKIILKNEFLFSDLEEGFNELSNVSQEFLGDQVKLDFYLKNAPTNA